MRVWYTERKPREPMTHAELSAMGKVCRIFLVRHGVSEANLNLDIYKRCPDQAISLAGSEDFETCSDEESMSSNDEHVDCVDESTEASLASAARFVSAFRYGETLCTNGFMQAAAAGEFLKRFYDSRARAGEHFRVAVITSSFTRARQTCEQITKRLGDYATGVREHILLGEQDFGVFDGNGWEELGHRFPVELERLQRARELGSWFWARFPLGESRFDVCRRALEFLGTLHRLAASGYTDFIIVTHGVTLRAFRMVWCRYSPEWLEVSKNPNNASIYLIDQTKPEPDRGCVFDGFPIHRPTLSMSKPNVSVRVQVTASTSPSLPTTQGHHVGQAVSSSSAKPLGSDLLRRYTRMGPIEIATQGDNPVSDTALPPTPVLTPVEDEEDSTSKVTVLDDVCIGSLKHDFLRAKDEKQDLAQEIPLTGLDLTSAMDMGILLPVANALQEGKFDAAELSRNATILIGRNGARYLSFCIPSGSAAQSSTGAIPSENYTDSETTTSSVPSFDPKSCDTSIEPLMDHSQLADASHPTLHNLASVNLNTANQFTPNPDQFRNPAPLWTTVLLSAAVSAIVSALITLHACKRSK